MGKFKKYSSIIYTFLIISGIIILFSKDNQNAGKYSGFTKINTSIYKTSIDTTYPVSKNGLIGFPETVEQIMARNKFVKIDSTNIKYQMREEHEVDRSNLPQNPESPNVSRYPKSDTIIENNEDSPQTVSTSFTAATLSGTNPTYSFPPDNMGAVGPTQFIVAVNGRIVTFNKTTGVADGVLNTDFDNFFVSVLNGSSTSDPRIRYDRQTQQWFIVIINVSTPNRILIAVSNSSTITVATTWYFYYIAIEALPPSISNTCLADYPTLGIDNNALYIGTNNFCGSPTQTFNSTDGYVIKKSTILSGGTMTITVFRGLVPTSISAGPYTPQGVDNFDASSTEGYFIGVDNATFGTLMIIRVSNPGGTPSISGNIPLTVPATYFPILVNHQGNTGGNSGRLDALDDRLFAAQLRNGKLWTAHNISVTNTGVVTGTRTRNACRWYEIQNLTGTPSLVQSGTVYTSNASNVTTDRNYWIPTVNISGQGHVAMVFSTAGSNERVNVGTVGRLSSDALGTMQTPTLITASSTAYNPTSDPGGAGGRRWGDYSYVSVDPEDDMTMWCVHQFCNATNSYGVRATKLAAPPPATPTSSNPSVVNSLMDSINVVITGTSASGSGWFDPGTGFSKRINATLSNGATLNKITYTDPTHVTLSINTNNVSASPNADVPIFVTIINPDGQSVTSSSTLITVQGPLPVELSSLTSTVKERNVLLKWTTESENNNRGFDIERKSANSQWLKIGFMTGSGNTNIPTNYSFEDKNLQTGKYKYRLKQIDFNGNFEYHDLNGEVEVGIPSIFNLSQNYPNPFNPTTKIDFDLPFDSKVNIVVYDITGRQVKKLVNENITAGYHTVQFIASDLSSGVYLYRISAKSENKDFVMTKRMVLVK